MLKSIQNEVTKLNDKNLLGTEFNQLKKEIDILIKYYNKWHKQKITLLYHGITSDNKRYTIKFLKDIE